MDSKVLIMGTTFKEDVSDIRNSKVVDVIRELESFAVKVEVIDPHASSEEVKHEYGYDLVDAAANDYDAIIVAVNHREYANLQEEHFKAMLKDGKGVFVDIKGAFRGKIKDLDYWSL
jgi:UDP-N-acetyl-D-galactosamine dehydrogenase